MYFYYNFDYKTELNALGVCLFSILLDIKDLYNKWLNNKIKY